ncbi:MAG TPA: response regulator transcription factor [Gaiellaceae bacterium]|nr:response regulator transcription factor [Gaiellaceae bacterium]
MEDDAIVRAWIRASLTGSEFRVGGEASTAADALALLERRRFDVLLVDFNLPDRKATALVQDLRRGGDTTPVLVITAAPRAGLNETLREAGAQGVLKKQADPGELLAALREVASGGQAFDYRVPRRPPGQGALSPREREVLALVAEGASNPAIAETLEIGRESVKTLVARILVKLGAANRVEAVAIARERGILP